MTISRFTVHAAATGGWLLVDGDTLKTVEYVYEGTARAEARIRNRHSRGRL
jgi:hypothetical protein